LLSVAAPVCSKRNTSFMTTTSPSIPVTSVRLVIRREPSFSRDCWTITSTAEEMCWRTTLSGNSIPAMSTIVSSRAMASRGVLAWMVVSEPS